MDANDRNTFDLLCVENLVPAIQGKLRKAREAVEPALIEKYEKELQSLIRIADMNRLGATKLSAIDALEDQTVPMHGDSEEDEAAVGDVVLDPPRARPERKPV